MNEYNVMFECECFDMGIVCSVGLFEKVGMLKFLVYILLVMGVVSGMFVKVLWLLFLVEEMLEGVHW